NKLRTDIPAPEYHEQRHSGEAVRLNVYRYNQLHQQRFLYPHRQLGQRDLWILELYRADRARGMEQLLRNDKRESLLPLGRPPRHRSCRSKSAWTFLRMDDGFSSAVRHE